MPIRIDDTTPPALDLLRGIAASGADGVANRALNDEGWPAPAASRLLDALRSRGYVRFDPATARWVATEAGRRRVDQAASAVTTAPAGGAP